MTMIAIHTNPVLIRPAKSEDIPAVLAIESKANATAHWPEAKYREAFEQGNPRRLVMVAEADSQICGFGVLLLHSECELENIAIAKALQRQGIATKLLLELLKSARSEGATSVFLEVRESNHPARSLYDRAGFHEVGRRKIYYQNPTEDAILYRTYLQNGTIPV